MRLSRNFNARSPWTRISIMPTGISVKFSITRAIWPVAYGNAKKKARSLENDPEALGLLAQAYIKTGRKSEGLKILAELNETARRSYVRTELFAMIHAALGDKSKAIRLLEDEPRFQELLAKVFPGNRP